MRLANDFFQRDVLEVAPDLLGKLLVVPQKEGEALSLMITEVEAYRGENDLACHASKGRTARTDIMYQEGGAVYIYLIYGMYWMLNFVTSCKEDPQAVLIRGVTGHAGPGKLTRHLGIDKSFHGEYLGASKKIWLEESYQKINFIQEPRINIQYSGEPWISKPWRYLAR